MESNQEPNRSKFNLTRTESPVALREKKLQQMLNVLVGERVLGGLEGDKPCRGPSTLMN